MSLEARAKRDDCRQRERLAEPQDPSQTKLPQSVSRAGSTIFLYYGNPATFGWDPLPLSLVVSRPARGTYISTGSRGC